MEKSVGPINGFYIVVYASASMDATRYTSYAKICRHQPASYWDARCLLKMFGGEHHRSAAAAIETAARLAREQIDDLPSLDCSTFGLGNPYFEPGSAQPA